MNRKVSSPYMPAMSPRHPPSTRPNRPLKTIAKDYQQLWKDITSTSDKGKAVRTLAEILLDKEGRSLISNLERKDAELCIEILDHVSRDPHLLPPPQSQMVSSGPCRAQPQNRRETGFLHCIEETRWNPWAIARIYDDNRGDRSFRRGTRLRWICRCQDRNVQGTPRRGQDHESFAGGWLPVDKKSEHRRYLSGRLGM